MKCIRRCFLKSDKNNLCKYLSWGETFGKHNTAGQKTDILKSSEGFCHYFDWNNLLVEGFTKQRAEVPEDSENAQYTLHLQKKNNLFLVTATRKIYLLLKGKHNWVRTSHGILESCNKE